MAELLVTVLAVLAVAGAEGPALVRRGRRRELVAFAALWALGAWLAVSYALGIKPPSLLMWLVEAVRPLGEAVFGPVR